MPAVAQSKIDEYKRRWGRLDEDRRGWFEHWREISWHLLPRSGRFLATTQQERGRKKHQHIYDNTAHRALNTLQAGLMAGMTSPARPWFALRTPDDDLNKFHSVKEWLAQVAEIMRQVFAGSNTYRALRTHYKQLGAFGTHVDFIFDDYEDVIRHYPLEIGEYAIALDDRGVVDTCYREFEMQVGAMVKRWGLANCTLHTQQQYNQKKYDIWIPILHVVEPRRDRILKGQRDKEGRPNDQGYGDQRNMPFSSCYMELKCQEPMLLSESGHIEFPGVAPRWEANGYDAYGESPGMITLGDIKQLQHQQLRKAQGIDFMTKPPLALPSYLKDKEDSMLPGGSVYFDSVQAAGSKPGALFQPNLSLADLLEDIRDVRVRIKMGFFEDMFLMLANDTRGTPPSAREIVERHEEKLLMVGPVLESLHDESLSPQINRTFARCLAAGLFPPPPPELHNVDLTVQFISVLAQAQRSVGLGAVDRFLGTIGLMSQLTQKQDAWDKVDQDSIIDGYAEMLGIDPDYVVADEEVILIRQKREKAAQAMQAAAVAPAMAAAAKDAAAAKEMSGNALTQAVGGIPQYQGYSVQ